MLDYFDKKLEVGDRVVRIYRGGGRSRFASGWVHSFTPKKVYVSLHPGKPAAHLEYPQDLIKVEYA